MKRLFPHAMYETLFGVAQLVLVVNALVAVMCAPLVVLLVTTDPSLAWPLYALAAALTGPSIAGAFCAFRAHRDGERGVVRPFLRGVRETWRRALAVSALVAAIVSVALVDVFVLVPTGYGAVAAPVLVVIAVLAVATGMNAIAALSEVPSARLVEVLRAAVIMSVRRWPFALGSLAAAGVQVGIFVLAPALAVGLTAAACLYVVWAGSRYSLQPVLRPAPTAPRAAAMAE
ncbi:ferredoxin-NADPH reductase [Microbacterium sp. G2-8]|uniref:ferredoxin-NADPH reductase n=1 Tax=Microbacterium sp. G2-8 TaxID=2842454 RepID=UPI001C8A88CF|nr:ferredoxin-NADPH reductase [Microbacterium sp. G2-8]